MNKSLVLFGVVCVFCKMVCSNSTSRINAGFVDVILVVRSVVVGAFDSIGGRVCCVAVDCVSCGISFSDIGRPSSVDNSCKSLLSAVTSCLFFSISSRFGFKSSGADGCTAISLMLSGVGLLFPVRLIANWIILFAKSGFFVVLVLPVLSGIAIWRWKRFR